MKYSHPQASLHSPITLSIVIPVRNRPYELKRCIESLKTSMKEAQLFCEIIVVDNGSTDQTRQTAESMDVTVLSEPHPNRCCARNLGARAASTQWVAFIDSDCVVEHEWVKQTVKALHHVPSKVRILAGKIIPAPPQTTIEAYIAQRRWIDQEKFLESGRRYSPPFAATANLIVHRKTFLQVGGLDPSLRTAGEDADFCWKVQKQGFEMMWAQSAEVVHYHRSTLKAMCRQSFDYGVGNAELFAKWRHTWNAQIWIEPRRYIWILKALLKIPWRVVSGKNKFERCEPFYDFLANTAMAYGRIWGGICRKVLVL